MNLTNREYVGRALELVIDGLGPFVDEVLTPHLTPEIPWTSLLEARDRASGIRGRTYTRTDLQAMLRVVTERLGNLGYPFGDRLTKAGQTLARDLREVRNRWAHHYEFTDDDTYRAVDKAEGLLRTIGATTEADAAAELRTQLRPAEPESLSPEPTDVASTPAPEAEPAGEPSEPEPSASPSILIDAVPVLSYAAAHNRIAIVNSVTIDNPGLARRGAVLTLEAASALGVASIPSEQFVDLAADGSVVLTNASLLLDAAQMLRVEERRPASITAVLEHEGEVLATARVDVELLAANHWVRQPANLSLELLAAHIQPNHPAITALLSEVSEQLLEATGSGSLEGYQGDEARVDQIAEAIYTCMQARKIRYSNPPASWGDEGQKIRTPAEVLDGRVGTCLDTSVVMAAAFEQVGINALVWLVEDHAFVGYWRVEASLGAASATDVMEAINIVDMGLIGVIESTCVTESDSPASFGEASRKPIVEHLAGRPQKILGVTDVMGARNAKIYPLPARTTNEDGTVTVVTYQAAQAADRRYDEYARAATPASPGRADVPYRVAQWKNSLLDLSLRNRLINFTARLTLAVPSTEVAHLEDLVNDSKSITLLPSDEVAEVTRARGFQYGRDLPEDDRSALLRDKGQAYCDVTDAAYTAKFRALAYRAKTIEEETGANNLYLAFGTLVWEHNGRDLRSPLVLVPVKLESARGGRYRVVLDESGSSTPNYCLLEKLKQSHGLIIPGLADPVEDGSGIDLEAAFTAMRNELDRAGLPYRVENSVDLAILAFAKFRLWKDLDENWEELARNSLVNHLIYAPTDVFANAADAAAPVDLDELAALCPVPADSSQLWAVAASVAGETFVLEGPPGTGKSQTITNLLVRAVAEGKKVLFVAEKRAALEVVQRRLDEVGLGEFALDLHDKGSRPNAVRAQIKAALQHRVSSDADGLSAALETLDGSRRSLARYASRLHERNASGLSMYSARNRLLAAEADTPTMEVPFGLVVGEKTDAIAELRQLFRLLPDVADPARPRPRHPWRLVRPANADSIDRPQLLAQFAEVDAAVAALPTAGRLAEVFDQLDAVPDFAALAGLTIAPRVSLDAVDAASTQAWKARADAAIASITAFLNSPHDVTSWVRPEIVDLPLDRIHEEALAADASSFFGRGKRQLAVRRHLEALLEPQALPKPRQVSQLTGHLAALRADVVALRAQFAAIEGLEQPANWNPLLEQDQTRLATLAAWTGWLATVLTPERRAPLRHFYADRVGDDPESEALITRAHNALAALDETLGDGAIEAWAGDDPLIPLWRTTAPERDVAGSGKHTLARWLELVAYTEPLGDHGLEHAREDILDGSLASEAASRAFDKGIAAASLEERADTTTLNVFVADAHNTAVRRFTTAADQVREHLVTDIPARLIRRRTFDGANSIGQIGELKRQLDRQRGGLGVRKLLDHFGPLIAELVPCMLMSPESVSRFFSAENNFFDIVVFDEASQIRVADAIGAMGRGASVVVVGDSKQMPPTSFAEPTIAVDDTDRLESLFVQDEESILSECVTAQVPSRALNWHYRSQDEALIRFSNEHYYGNLSSFPSPLHGSVDEGIAGHGISLVRVDGTFLRSATGKRLRTNPVEAEAIVEEIKRRFLASPDAVPSLGVVTFNAPQRSLVESLLRDSGDSRIVEALDSDTEGLFVKNLENVQGDERDAILFSTAFSANEKGMLPLNFGPVSQAGGERRLNVAITRARRQVVLFSSFDPQDLRTEDTSSVGLKHLRAYLELAKSGGASPPRAFREETVDRHREEIADALRERGLVVATDVGLSGFRIDLSLATSEEPDRPVVAVLLDNPSWAARRTVADRDGLPTAVLSGLMKWPAVARVWMPEWLDDREGVLDVLTGLASSAAMSPDATAAVQISAADEELEQARVDVEVSEAPRARPIGRESFSRERSLQIATGPAAATVPGTQHGVVFEPWASRRIGGITTLDRLPARDAADDVEGIIREIVAAEGPVHAVRLAKLVAGAFGLDRVAQSRAESILRCVPREFRAAGDRHFFWPAELDPDDWNDYRRTPGGIQRDFEHVHPREIVNAMAALCVRGAGLYEDELRRETLNFFGLTRMTPRMTAILDNALKRALAGGRLERAESGLLATPN